MSDRPQTATGSISGGASGYRAARANIGVPHTAYRAPHAAYRISAQTEIYRFAKGKPFAVTVDEPVRRPVPTVEFWNFIRRVGVRMPLSTGEVAAKPSERVRRAGARGVPRSEPANLGVPSLLPPPFFVERRRTPRGGYTSSASYSLGTFPHWGRLSYGGLSYTAAVCVLFAVWKVREHQGAPLPTELRFDW